MKNNANRAPWIKAFIADAELCSLLNYTYKNIDVSSDVFNKTLSWVERFDSLISIIQGYPAYRSYFDAIDTDHYFFYKDVKEIDPATSNKIRGYLKRWLTTMIIYDELVEKLKVNPEINYKLWLVVGNITSLTIGFENAKHNKAYITSDFNTHKVVTPFTESDNVYIRLESEKAKPKTQSGVIPARKLYPVVLDWFKSLKN